MVDRTSRAVGQTVRQEINKAGGMVRLRSAQQRDDTKMGRTYAARYGCSSAWSTVSLFFGSNVCAHRKGWSATRGTQDEQKGSASGCERGGVTSGAGAVFRAGLWSLHMRRRQGQNQYRDAGTSHEAELGTPSSCCVDERCSRKLRGIQNGVRSHAKHEAP